MKLDFHRTIETPDCLEEDLTPVRIQDSLEKTRQDLEIAYAGFNNAVEIDLIDSYIYEINSLQKRYKHLTNLAALEPAEDTEHLYQHSSIRTLVSHVFG